MIHLADNYWCKTNSSLITTDFLCNNLNVSIKCIYLCLINNLLFSGHLKKFFSLAIYLLIFTSLCFQTLYKVHKIFHPRNKRPKAQNQSIKMSCLWIQFNRFFICEIHRGAIEFGGRTHFAQGNFSLFFSVCLPRKWMKKISYLCGSLVVYVYIYTFDFRKSNNFTLEKNSGKIKEEQI